MTFCEICGAEVESDAPVALCPQCDDEAREEFRQLVASGAFAPDPQPSYEEDDLFVDWRGSEEPF